jgi:hypothetical protein
VFFEANTTGMNFDGFLPPLRPKPPSVGDRLLQELGLAAPPMERQKQRDAGYGNKW